MAAAIDIIEVIRDAGTAVHRILNRVREVAAIGIAGASGLPLSVLLGVNQRNLGITLLVEPRTIGPAHEGQPCPALLATTATATATATATGAIRNTPVDA